MAANPRVGIIMGSDSDLPTMKAAAEVCAEFEVPYSVAIVSAHRTPGRMFEFAASAHSRGLKVIVAGAGGRPTCRGWWRPSPSTGHWCAGAGHCPGGVDALYSIVQMPAGIPVATVAIGNARNAGLLAVQILATADPVLQQKMIAYRERLRRGRKNRPASKNWVGGTTSLEIGPADRDDSVLGV